MGYRINRKTMDQIIEKLSRDYRVCAPKWDVRKKKVRYGEITSVSENVLDRQSDFSPKEIYYPVSQTMFYFTEDNVKDGE